MQNQQFEEDRAELEAHFTERVKAYVELGETQEQAEASAREKFGSTEPVLRELRWQRALRHPLAIGVLGGLCWLALAALPFLGVGKLLAKEESLVLIFLGRAYAALAPTALLVVWKGTERHPHRSVPLILGILAFCLLIIPTRDGLVALMALLPTLHGALVGLRLAVRSRRREKRV